MRKPRIANGEGNDLTYLVNIRLEPSVNKCREYLILEPVRSLMVIMSANGKGERVIKLMSSSAIEFPNIHRGQWNEIEIISSSPQNDGKQKEVIVIEETEK